MSSSVTRRRQPSRAPRPSQGSGFRRPIIWSVLIVTTVWSIAAAAYFGLRKDDTQLMAGMQASYERRIADLRAELDRTTNQQLLEQKRIQDQLDALLQKQATLEQHTPTIPDDQLATGSISAKEPAASSLASAPPVAEPPRAPASRNRRVFVTVTACARIVGRQRSRSNMLESKQRQLLLKWISATAAMRLSNHLFAT